MPCHGYPMPRRSAASLLVACCPSLRMLVSLLFPIQPCISFPSSPYLLHYILHYSTRITTVHYFRQTPHALHCIRQAPHSLQSYITLGKLEVYNEKVYDLLNPQDALRVSLPTTRPPSNPTPNNPSQRNQPNPIQTNRPVQNSPVQPIPAQPSPAQPSLGQLRQSSTVK